jgi:lysophospholipase L1-like esterase
MRRCPSVALLALACTGVLAAPAAAQLHAHLGSVRPGWVALRVTGAPGAVVAVSENGAVLAQIRLGKDGRRTVRRLSAWRCGIRDRAFVVGGLTLTTRTPGCASRVRVAGLPRPHAGQWFGVRVMDRWRLGNVHANVCVVAPAGAYACRATRVRRHGTTVRFKAPRPGRWAVTVNGAVVSAQRPLLIRPATTRKLRVLATGDSLMIRVARHIARLLKSNRVLVQQDIHFGAAISHDFVFDWRKGSRADADSAHPPDVVVLFLGGSEGPPFGAIPCCGQDWIDEYTARVRQIVKTYRRGGATQVYWLNLPAPEDPNRVPAFRAANQGLVAAMQGLAPWVRVVDEAELLTPGFVYRYSAIIDGKETILRQSDGLHLSRAGAIMTAEMVKQWMRTDGVIP